VSHTISADSLSAVLLSDPELRYRLNAFSGRIRLSVADVVSDLVVDDSDDMRVEDPQGTPTIHVSIPQDVLEAASLPVIPAGFEGITIARSHGVEITGELSLTAAFAGALARIYTLVQEANGADRAARVAPDEALFKGTDDAIGRYVYVTVDDVEYRMYYETSGHGPTDLMLQHTAGADARQWRHQLADPEFQSRFRVIAYDLPFHGRSLPPVGVDWWAKPYLPTKTWLEKVVIAFADALALDKPIFMGCSVGGQLALDLSADHGSRFAASVSLNGSYDNDLKVGDPGATAWDDLCRDPQVSADNYAFGMYGVTSPIAVEAYRRELYWIYRSNAHGVYAGDNDYFSWGHDLAENGHLIDTARTPTYLLAGEYDPVAVDPVHGGPAAAANIPGLEYRLLPGLGHFAPTDEPLLFRDAVIPILDEILSLLSRGALSAVES
jgi:pimeloyl-ACP methyl ester carboxylesterase